MEELSLKELAERERKEYFRAWRAANKDKTAQHRRNYWEKRALAKIADGQIQGVKADDAATAGANNA